MASLGGEYTLTYNTFDLLYNVLVAASFLDRGLQSATVYLANSLLFRLIADSVRMAQAVLPWCRGRHQFLPVNRPTHSHRHRCGWVSTCDIRVALLLSTSRFKLTMRCINNNGQKNAGASPKIEFKNLKLKS